jgi:two-component system sensor histidine kinase KdpD
MAPSSSTSDADWRCLSKYGTTTIRSADETPSPAGQSRRMIARRADPGSGDVNGARVACRTSWLVRVHDGRVIAKPAGVAGPRRPRRRSRVGVLPSVPPRARLLTGIASSTASVSVVTAVVALLRPHVPVLSLGALYVFAVLPISIFWGLAYAIPVSIASMLAFNFFFLPPVHTFTLSDSSNWFALAVFLVTGIVASELAARLRRRARESALLAGIAGSLLERGNVEAELDRIAAQVAPALQVDRARIELAGSGVGRDWYPLVAGEERVGAILLQGGGRSGAAARRRVVTALASLLAVALDRERLAREALEAEALRRSDSLKTALLRAVSHDLRTPLMAISASATTLAHAGPRLGGEDQAALVSTIISETRRLDRLVGNLLDLSRLQAGAAQPQPQLWTVDELIVQALGSLAEGSERVEVGLGEESLTVEVDAAQIQRVLANLIENGLRHTEGPVLLQVSQAGDEALVRVIDRGSGIPHDELERIFEPFQRGSRAAGVRGAGLGLAIARGFAQANGARVWAESRPHQGATFVLALPLAPSQAVQA